MDGLQRQGALIRLKAEIERMEQRPALARTAMDRLAGSDIAALDLPGGLLHEVFTPDRRDGTAALGFTLAAAKPLLSPSRPVVLFLQLVHEARESGLPYAPGLAAFGLAPEAVAICRTANIAELLWAMEEAASCRAIAAIVADIAGHPRLLDFTASRRLALRADAAGTSLFLIRYGREREASAAQLRWAVQPAVSGQAPYDARASGAVRWRVDLEKGLAARGGRGAAFLLEWTDHGFVLVEHGGAAEPSRRGGAALPGAEPAALGHRLAQTA